MAKRLIVLLVIVSAFATGCRKTDDVKADNTRDNPQLEMLFADNPPQMCINKAPVATDDKQTHGVVLRNKYWPNGKKIRIKFLNGDSFLQQKMLTYAGKWSQYGNITFVKVTGTAAHDIRVAFKYDGDESSWSYIGTDATRTDKTKPTMNFGWFTKTTAEDEFSRVIVHEVGHALGLAHEQNSPAVNIKWNKTNVYWYYKRPPNSWTTAQIDYNIFYRYPSSQVHYSPYDSKSIMQYPVDPRFTTDGKGIGWNTVLSSMDKIVIGKVYPK